MGTGLWSLRNRIKSRRVVEGGFELMEHEENAEIVRDRIISMNDLVGCVLSGLAFTIAVIGNLGEGFID